MKALKRVLLLCLALQLLVMSAVPAFAAGTVALLSSDEAQISDSTVLVPVNISDNPGIMGFKLTAEYASEKIEITNVTAGVVTAKGNFIHNAGKVDGKVDIIWYSTEQTLKDGNLFVLSVKSTANFVEGESTQIALSFSQADTFNEAYEDVAFDCRPISIIYGNATAQPNTEPQTQESAAETELTDEQLIGAVNVALENSESERIDDINSDTLDRVNNNLRTIAGPNAPQFGSVEELRSRYTVAQRNEYTNNLSTNIGRTRIQEIINEELTTHNATKIEVIPDQEKGSFVAAIDEKLQSEDKLVNPAPDVLSTDDLIDIYKEMMETDGDESEQSSKTSILPLTIIIISVIVVAVIIAGAILVKKRRKRK